MKPFLTGLAELVGFCAFIAVLFLWFIVMGA
jgi:hypothetical protein